MTRRSGAHQLRWLGVVHACAAAGDAFFTVSLADSLFFNVSLDAARPRLLLYLAVTMAPFALLAPLIGPFVDRVRGGQRTVLIGTNVVRAALAFALIDDLRTLLMFPEAFGVLVLGKSYSIGRSATVPRLVERDDDLVVANARLARIGLVAGSVGGASAAGLLALFGSDGPLTVATLAFLASALAATFVRTGARREAPTPLEHHELHGLRLTRAVHAVGLIRGSIGLFTFVVGFELKRTGAPLWQFGAVLALGGAGAVVATIVTPRLKRRWSEEGLLVAVVGAPALASVVGVIRFSFVGALLAAAVLGMASAAARHLFDSFVQRSAPDADMARAFARFETQFQLYWIAGSVIAVVAQPAPRLGLLIVIGATIYGAISLELARQATDRYEAPPSLVAAVSQLVLADAPVHDVAAAVLDAAEVLAKGGSPRAAIVVAAAAIEVQIERAALGDAVPVPDDVVARIRAAREAAVRGRAPARDAVDEVIAVARGAVDAAGVGDG